LHSTAWVGIRARISTIGCGLIGCVVEPTPLEATQVLADTEARAVTRIELDYRSRPA
jgi:hypothetical protein